MVRERLNYAVFSYVLDLLATLAALRLATDLRLDFSLGRSLASPIDVPLPLVGLTLVIWSIVFFTLSVYEPRRTYRAADEFQTVFVATTFSLLVLAGALYFSYRQLSRLLIVYFYVLDVAILFGWRSVARLVFKLLNGRTYRPRNVVIVGVTELGRQAAEMIQQREWMGLRLLGFLDDRESPSTPFALPILGSFDETRRIVEQHNVEEVVIALHNRAYSRLNQIVADLHNLPVHIRIVPDYLSLALYRATVEDFGGVPLINLRDPALTGYQRMVKRAFDLIVGTLVTIVALPIMALIAVAIKLDSPGPVLFRQERIGENGRRFIMYKFRSMVENADEQRREVLQHDEQGNVIHKVPDDPRVTRVGCFIRRTSMDELPQLFNVLKGDMSLVGPRPELPWLVEEYEPWQRKRFAVPQGITGWWQINGRSDKPMHLHTEDDLYYIQNYSLLLDVQILWKTIAVVLKRQGAF